MSPGLPLQLGVSDCDQDFDTLNPPEIHWAGLFTLPPLLLPRVKPIETLTVWLLLMPQLAWLAQVMGSFGRQCLIAGPPGIRTHSDLLVVFVLVRITITHEFCRC